MKAKNVALAVALAVPLASEAGEVYDPPCGEGQYILTPAVSEFPAIQGASVFGVRPGSPFLYAIPATGERPVQYAVEHLPDGLNVDRNTGVISGIISEKPHQEYRVTLIAENIHGRVEKQFSIRVGDKICLTPPLGWNSWNCWGNQVDQDKVMASARAMTEKGLADYGWSYINIDDTWQGKRGGKFNAIQGDPEKFPDIKEMCDTIHKLGLKVGIYSSPWVTTYAGCIGGSSENPQGEWDRENMSSDDWDIRETFWKIGQHTFDDHDAMQWAEWGIDYLKYDWNPNDPESTLRMAAALKDCGRDIVYSLSNTAPLEHAELYGKHVNCWRTAGDLKDRWDQDGSHINVVEQWKLHRNWMEEGVRGGPGHFPDPDMLVVGNVVSNNKGTEPRPTRLTPDEQYSHISLWVLWSAPLLIGCPIESMDDFTLKLLTNSEVLAIHQDEKAVPGRSTDLADGIEVVVKELADGGKAIGIFNRNETAQVVELDWKTVGLSGTKILRDVWRQQDIGEYDGVFTANVQSHGVVFVRAN